jgi:hypothetical protein
VNKVPPVQIVHVSLQAAADKASSDNWPAVKPSLLIKLLAVDQPPGSFALPAAAGFLYNEPFWEPPDANPFGGLTRIVLVGRRSIEPRRRDPRHDLEYMCEP